MAEAPFRPDQIAHTTLQFRRVRKAAIALSVPDQLVIAGDGEHTAGRRNQYNLFELLTETGEQLLRHPASPQQPAALGAIGDPDDDY